MTSSIKAPVPPTIPPVIHYAWVLRRQAWVVVTVLAAVLAIAAAVTATEAPVYRASMAVVGQGGEIAGSAQPLTQTLTSLMESQALATQVIARLDLKIQPSVLLSRLSVTTPPQSSVLTATYDDRDPRIAVAVLDQLGQIFPTFVTRTLAPASAATGSRGPPVATATVFDRSSLSGQVSPTWKRNLLVAVVIGLLLGLVAAFGRDAIGEQSGVPPPAPPRLLAMLRMRWWVVGLLGVLGAGVGAGVIAVRDGVGYTSSTILMRTEPTVTSGDVPWLAAADPRVSYPAAIRRASLELSGVSPATLAGQTHVAVTGADEAAIVDTTRHPSQAVARSGAVARAFASSWNAVYAGLRDEARAGLRAASRAPDADLSLLHNRAVSLDAANTQVTLSVAPTGPAVVLPRPIARTAGLGLLLGLLAGAAAAACLPIGRRRTGPGALPDAPSPPPPTVRVKAARPGGPRVY